MAKRVNLFASAARTATVTTPVIAANDQEDTYNALYVVVDVTAGTAFNLTPSIGLYDSASAKTITLLTGSVINATGTTLLRVGPAYTAGANVAKEYVPAEWTATFTISGGIGATFSANAHLV